MTQPPDLNTLPDMPRVSPAPAGPAATGLQLGPPQLPFPVEVPAQVRPDLCKLGDQPLLTTDSLWPVYFQEKRRRLNRPLIAGQHAEPGAVQANDNLQPFVGLIAQQFQRYAPLGPVCADTSLPWLGLGPTQSFASFFYGLAMSLQEDIVLMLPNAQGELYAKAMCVCFPSGWVAQEKIGKSFTDIHADVADNQDMLRATQAMSHAMANKGPYVRYVWTLSGSGELARPPGWGALSHVTHLSDCWFRCERQVTIALDGLGSLFLIRVYVAPLQAVLQTPGRRARLLNALHSMSDALKRYKGLERAIELIQ